MKHEISKAESGFEPIKVEITLESREELVEFVKRLNLAPGTLDKENGLYYKHFDTGKRAFKALWVELDSKAIDVVGEPYFLGDLLDGEC